MIHTYHPRDGDNGKYFIFDATDFTKMVGETEWDDKTYEVIKRGSNSWTGMIRVWDGSTGQYGIAGRRDANPAAGHWAQGDTIQLKACVEAGI